MMDLTWLPDLSSLRGPRYRAIADCIARDIDRGVLSAGDRLPPQRELAWALGVTVGTVSRGYQEADRRGLTEGQIGRGTYVRNLEAAPFRDETYETTPQGAPRPLSSVIDMRMNTPVVPDNGNDLRLALRTLSQEGDCALLGSYGSQAGSLPHRTAGAAWIARAGLTVAPDQVLVTAGVQHALLMTAMATMRPGDVMATEALAYPGLAYVASSLNLIVKPVAFDEQGLLPEAFDAACRQDAIKVLYSVPTFHNPTGATQPDGRRQEIAAIARRHDVLIVEDDIYGMLPSVRPAPIATHAPERTFYATSVSKSMMPGLRIGFLAAPPAFYPALERAMASSVWMVPPLAAEVVARWIADGTADQMNLWHRREARRRNAVARAALTGVEITAHPNAYHLWLPVPEPLRATAFAAALAKRGLLVHPSDMFAIGRGSVPHAVRLCLAPEPDENRIQRAMAAVMALLRDPQCVELPLL